VRPRRLSKRFSASGALAAALALALPAQAQMYKCVDARGVTHYADQPTAGCKNATVDIRPSPPISGRLAPPPADPAQQDADFRRRQLERAEAERDEREQRAALESRCAALRQDRTMLTAGTRLVQLNAQGERVYLDDATRARRLADVAAALGACP
jgi:hypothetical protein